MVFYECGVFVPCVSGGNLTTIFPQPIIEVRVSAPHYCVVWAVVLYVVHPLCLQ